MVRIWQLLRDRLLLMMTNIYQMVATSASNSTDAPETFVALIDRYSTAQKSDLMVLKLIVELTKIAIEADNLDAAKTEFAEFEAYWRQTADLVKAGNMDAYHAIEDVTRSIANGIANQQSNEILLAKLLKLRESIDLASDVLSSN
ncbi:hypothetical protein [Chamaesiphon minutus]|uniref:Uncharacterized protein n=1 Tax=Chamaesiphon minutus (strain ATCC 27169 / PCC 6605) TaxID=1173020 RepID=K9UEY0_CHAP6|nr:hypothetical protein [Chamaesiphon minutus]AFY92981.1 hypothetical protein Cha6605_1870 [Chamaesiphon minutus PCC 6605]